MFCSAKLIRLNLHTNFQMYLASSRMCYILLSCAVLYCAKI
nr:MAG TPA: hypothetical protein [Bacteriophage sp.]